MTKVSRGCIGCVWDAIFTLTFMDLWTCYCMKKKDVNRIIYIKYIVAVSVVRYMEYGSYNRIGIANNRDQKSVIIISGRRFDIHKTMKPQVTSMYLTYEDERFKVRSIYWKFQNYYLRNLVSDRSDKWSYLTTYYCQATVINMNSFCSTVSDKCLWQKHLLNERTDGRTR